jgi:competence protein ComEA
VPGTQAGGARDIHALAVLLLAVALGVGTALPLFGPAGPDFSRPRATEQAAQLGDRAPGPRGGPSPTRFQSSLVGIINLNTADAETLQALPGIGPTLAGRIVAYRLEHGSFQTVEDLLQVPGMGAKRWERIRHAIRVRAEEP